MEHLDSVALAPAGGIAWTTVIAAAIAALVGVANLWASLVTGARQRSIDRRAQWWSRFTWAAEMSVTGSTGMETDLGLTVLDTLIGATDGEAKDSTLALAIAENVRETGRNRENREGGGDDGHPEVQPQDDGAGQEA
ncbi:hypothetical protein [Agrococcus sp. KRD186]|uniref:hypothetical protein n=1 Tax=Agrococcus sp. KRD186 TaxID=2729730 RepID=UPI0019D1D8D1|nr:hypothetical protein [Agrococcus sp. KRD186]